jgi:hypothetical protein
MKTHGWTNLAVVAVVTLISALSGCTRASQLDKEASDVHIHLGVDPDPPIFGRPCQLVVTLLEPEGAPIDGATLQIKGDMTHAGMVPVVVTVSESVSGSYSTPFDWTMAGDWILTVQAHLPDGRMVRRQFEVTVGMPGG